MTMVTGGNSVWFCAICSCKSVSTSISTSTSTRFLILVKEIRLVNSSYLYVAVDTHHPTHPMHGRDWGCCPPTVLTIILSSSLLLVLTRSRPSIHTSTLVLVLVTRETKGHFANLLSVHSSQVLVQVGTRSFMPVVVFLFYVLSCAILNYQYWNMMCEAVCGKRKVSTVWWWCMMMISTKMGGQCYTITDESGSYNNGSRRWGRAYNNGSRRWGRAIASFPQRTASFNRLSWYCVRT